MRTVRYELSMARNVEIKASIQSIEDLLERVVKLTESPPENIEQDDTFFYCDNGRLKLRELSDGTGELIFYNRSKAEGPKTCVYEIVPIEAVDLMRRALSKAYGQSGRVKKHRTMYMVGRTRVHLDQVEGLGTFMELEVVLNEGESEVVGEHEARELMAALGIENSTLIDRPYVDLLNEKGT
jgi:predicted adenylyl cyclase CyaB